MSTDRLNINDLDPQALSFIMAERGGGLITIVDDQSTEPRAKISGVKTWGELAEALTTLNAAGVLVGDSVEVLVHGSEMMH